MRERVEIHVQTPPGGWGWPWPLVAEVEGVLSHEYWTLVGGLMAQVHAIHRGIAVVRPTNDVDLVVHLETRRGAANTTAGALESIGFQFRPSIDERSGYGHRFMRPAPATSLQGAREDIVDVLRADHVAPRVVEKLRGRNMVPIAGGTQALRRTVNAHLTIADGRSTTVSIPSPFGAAMLKAAAYRADSRDRERHLLDAALLLATIDDPYQARETVRGSDGSRLRILKEALPLSAPAWIRIPEPWRTAGQTALAILTG